VVKENLFPVPPLFRHLQKESGTVWEEMYKVFNMGHRMELYTTTEVASKITAISEQFGVEARIIGKVEPYKGKKVILKTEFGEFNYEN
jgi:phosphoribosylformylglycinamidine cyclo-ligase